jgi:SpoVK/Ycf46/Vps4 family AAA+-type ATPase
MKKNSNKANSKKIQQNLNLKTALKLKITKSDTKSHEWEDSLLFKIYIKSSLMNKQNQMNTSFNISVFNQNRTYFINDAETKEGLKINDDEEFLITEESEIEIMKNPNLENFSSNNLSEEFEKKLSLDKKEEIIFKKILESKYLKNNNKEEFSKVELVGYKQEFNKVEQLIKTVLENEIQKILIQNDYESNYTTSTEKKNSPQPSLDSFTYKGILVSGPNGIGKTHFIKYIQRQYKEKINFFQIDLIEDLVLNKKSGSDSIEESERFEDKLQDIFKYAKMVSPSIIVLEELDRLFNKEDSEEGSSAISSSMNTSITLNDLKTKILFSLLKEIDDLKIDDKVLVISSCLNADKLFSDLRKSGRFDYVLSLTTPDFIQRKQLLQYISKNFKNNLSEEDFEVLADKSHGFVAGDIFQIFKDSLITPGITMLKRKDLENALKNIKPINLKDVILDVPKVLWDDIGGNKEIIKKIRQSIEWPLKNPDAFKKIGISPPNGILLYGPPGCSKTMIAKALATESGLNFFAVKGPELFSKYVGDTEKAIRDIFKKAKISSPSIIFFDEIDAMASQRGSDSHVSDKVLCQLLNEMDGIEGREKVVIFGATNRPDILDKAMIRPGRFDRLIFIPPPDRDARKEIFKINLNKMSVGKDVNIDYLVDLAEVCF